MIEEIFCLYFFSIFVSVFVLLSLLYFLSSRDCLSSIAVASDGSRLGGIDGLRGYLALFVFFYHLYVAFVWGETGIWVFPDEKMISALGKIPVFIFFVITGFLFASNVIYSERKPSWRRVYVGRFFRIQPLYIFVVMVLMLFSAIATDRFELSLRDLYSLFIWLLYLGGDNRGNFFGYDDSWLVIAGVHWTLRYEWLFYFLLPALYYLYSFNVRLFFVVISSVMLMGSVGVSFAGLSFFYISLFLVGVLSASLSMRYVERMCSLISSRYGPDFLLIISLFMTISCYLKDVSGGIQIGLLLMFVALRGGAHFFGILRWRSSILLGEISYSIYLTHGIVLFLIYTIFDVDEWIGSYFVLAPLVTVLVILLSLSTYFSIEKRFIDIGYKIRSKI